MVLSKDMLNIQTKIGKTILVVEFFLDKSQENAHTMKWKMLALEEIRKVLK